MAHVLVVVRHAKSDWNVPVGDRERPLARRGLRQAPTTGRWIAEHLDPAELAVVSVATRARQTWELVDAELPEPPSVQVAEAAYTFVGDELLDLVRELPPDAGTVLLVGHNPALEELVESLTGRSARLPTSALAVIELPTWSSLSGRLRAVGRPADADVWLDGEDARDDAGPDDAGPDDAGHR